MNDSVNNWVNDSMNDERSDTRPARREAHEGNVVGGPRPTRPPGKNDGALEGLAWILDDAIRIPGLNVRLGLDALIGLVPGFGDAAGTLLGSAVLVGAVRHRVPMRVLLVMAWNLLFDKLIGLIPFIGDAADAVHRANSKNYRLLRRTVEAGDTVDTDSRGYLIRAVLLVAVIVLILIAFSVVAIWLVWQALSALFGF